MLISKEQLKREAKLLKKERGIKSSHAHELIARSYGYNSYNHFLSKVSNYASQK